MSNDDATPGFNQKQRSGVTNLRTVIHCYVTACVVHRPADLSGLQYSDRSTACSFVEYLCMLTGLKICFNYAIHVLRFVGVTVVAECVDG